MSRLTESRATRAKLPQTGQTFIWCSEITGFGVRLTPGSRSYIVQLPYDGKKPRITLGPVGTLPFEGPVRAPGARDLALAALNAARRGEDPRLAIGQRVKPEGLTLDDLWAAYETAGFPKLKGTGRKRASTIRNDRYRYNFALRPALGRIAVSSIDTARVRRWLDTVGAEGQRSHALALLKTLLSFATSRGLAPANQIAIAITPSRQQQDFYTPDELARLDAALVEMIAEKPSQALPLTALRLLIATGARKGEILGLRWRDVDFDNSVITLERDKVSLNRRNILLTDPAVAALKALPRTGSDFVFFSGSVAGHLADVQKPWNTAVARAGVRRLRKHDLRHSFASAAIREGVPLFTLGRLLGHRQATTTARYAHIEEGTAREALERVARAIGPAK